VCERTGRSPLPGPIDVRVSERVTGDNREPRLDRRVCRFQLSSLQRRRWRPHRKPSTCQQTRIQSRRPATRGNGTRATRLFVNQVRLTIREDEGRNVGELANGKRTLFAVTFIMTVGVLFVNPNGNVGRLPLVVRIGLLGLISLEGLFQREAIFL
jgi:hypothetical protein